MISKTRIKQRIKRKSNPQLIELAHFLKKQSPFWQKITTLILTPKRKSIKVNIYKIEKASKEGDTIIVPGKVLSDGVLSKQIILSALAFSEKAKSNLSKAKIISLKQLAEKNKSGEGIKVLI